MKALCWNGVNKLSVRSVDDPGMLNDGDAIVQVAASSACGSDLHLLGGFVPTMRSGDVIGHEFVGEVVDVGRDVRRHKVGDRVVVASPIGCGRCWHCANGEWSLCDNSNPLPAAVETLYGDAGAAFYGYSHAFGGFAGSHAQYVRVPFADYGAFPVPEGLRDDQVVFVSDAVPTGWMAAEMGGVGPGDVVAVWGCGGVGQMAASAASAMGASRVLAIDRLPDRLAAVERHAGAEPLNYADTDIDSALREATAGRGVDVCIEAVGMEAHGRGLGFGYDRTKQAMRLQTDRSSALREAIHACRKGGTVSIVGVFGGLVDKFPMGAVMNKGLTLRAGQQHGQRYVPTLLDRISRGQLDPSYLATHTMSLDDGPSGYAMFKEKRDGCLRVVFRPNG